MLSALLKPATLLAIGFLIGKGWDLYAKPSLWQSSCMDVYTANHGGQPVVYSISDLWQHARSPEAGLAHLTVAGSRHHGMRAFEVWWQTLAPGVSTPIHSHDCEELNVVVKMKNTSPGDLTLLVVMGCAPGHIDVYDIFSPEARPHRIFPMPWDEDCPPEVPAGFRDLSHENDSISQHFRLLPEG